MTPILTIWRDIRIKRQAAKSPPVFNINYVFMPIESDLCDGNFLPTDCKDNTAYFNGLRTAVIVFRRSRFIQPLFGMYAHVFIFSQIIE